MPLPVRAASRLLRPSPRWALRSLASRRTLTASARASAPRSNVPLSKRDLFTSTRTLQEQQESKEQEQPTPSLFEDHAADYSEQQSNVVRDAPASASPAGALLSILSKPLDLDQKLEQASATLAELSAVGARAEPQPEFLELARHSAQRAVEKAFYDPQARSQGESLRRLQQTLAWVVLTAPRDGPRFIENRDDPQSTDVLEETVLMVLQATESPSPAERVLLYQLALVLVNKNMVRFALLERVVEQIAYLPPIISVNHAPDVVRDDWRSWCSELVEKLADQVDEGPDQDWVLSLHDKLDRHLFPSHHAINAISPVMGDHLQLSNKIDIFPRSMYLGGASFISPQILSACLPNLKLNPNSPELKRTVDEPKRYPTEIEAWLFLKALLVNLQSPDIARIDLVYQAWLHNVRSTFRAGDRDLVYLTETHPNVELPKALRDMLPSELEAAAAASEQPSEASSSDDAPVPEEPSLPALGAELANVSKLLDPSKWKGFGDLVIEPPPRVPIKPVSMQLLMGIGFDSWLTLWAHVHRSIMAPAINANRQVPQWELTPLDTTPHTTLYHSRARQILADMTELGTTPIEKEWSMILDAYFSAGKEFQTHTRRLASALRSISEKAVDNWQWKNEPLENEGQSWGEDDFVVPVRRVPTTLPPHLQPPQPLDPDLLQARRRPKATTPDPVLEDALSKVDLRSLGTLSVRTSALMHALHTTKNQGGRQMLEANALFDEMWDHVCQNERIGIEAPPKSTEKPVADASEPSGNPQEAKSSMDFPVQAKRSDEWTADAARCEALYNFILDTLKLPVGTRVANPREPYADGIPPSQFTRAQFLRRPAGHVMRSFFENSLWLALRKNEPPYLIRMDQRGLTWFTKVLVWAQHNNKFDALIAAMENSNNGIVRKIFLRDREARSAIEAAREELSADEVLSSKERLLQRRVYEQSLLERLHLRRDDMFPDPELDLLRNENKQRLAEINLERIQAGLPEFDPFDFSAPNAGPHADAQDARVRRPMAERYVE